MSGMALAQAEKFAAAIKGWLEPHCFRIEVAGSIRRKRAVCNDVDLVCIPKLAPVRDLLGKVVQTRNLLTEFLDAYVKRTPEASWRAREGQAAGQTPAWDASNLLLRLPKCELDVWCADERNFATRFLCRTGSKEHNVWFAQLAIEQGLKWRSYEGLSREGMLIETGSEADLYAVLGLPWIPPEARDWPALGRYAGRNAVKREVREVREGVADARKVEVGR